jgi:hypothetical protein
MITYRATNILNGKFYIGSSRNLVSYEKRKKSHLRGKGDYPFQRALRKNLEAFEWEYVEDDCEKPVLEQAQLDQWYGKEQCYNLNPFADRGPDRTGKKQPDGWGKRHSDKLRGRPNPGVSIALRGRSRPEEVKKKISIANTGKVRTQEVKDRISATLTGTSWGTHTEEHKNNMSDKYKGEGNPAYGRKWWVNSEGETKLQVECPGEGWVKGKEPGHVWWVNSSGEVKRQKNCPGEGWQRGRKWKG